MRPLTVQKRIGQLWLSPGSWGPGWRDLCEAGGYKIVQSITPSADVVAGFVLAGKEEGLRANIVQMDRVLPQEVPIFCQVADTTVSEVATWIKHPERLVGFDGLFSAFGSLVTLVLGPGLDPGIQQEADQFIQGLGRRGMWIEESPGLILPRIICMLANEAAFAVQDQVASPDTIDLAMRLGVNYPQGPLAWAGQIGFRQVLQVLEHLQAEFSEPRYRPAPKLRRWARESLL